MSWTEFHPFIQEATLTTLAVGLLVLFVLVIRKPFAKRYGAKAAYLLWALPLARFVTPPLPGNWSLAGLLGFTRPTPETALPGETELVVNGQTYSIPFEMEWTAAPAPMPEAAAGTPQIGEIAFTPAPVAETVAPTTSLLEATLAQAPLILTCVWITGVVLWLGRSFYQQHQFLELIADDSEPAEPATVAETMRIAKQLGIKRVPDVRASLLCSGPLVTGLTKPVILLPMWFEEDYEAAERRDALVHELMHLKRRDLWAFQAARIVAATQWFNPLAYTALRAFRTDQEAACDADVIKRAKLSPAAYGRTLVKAARLARPSDRRIAAASLTLAHPIKERLIMMTHPTPTLRSRLMGGTLAVALGAGAIFTTASCTSSVAQELDGAPQEESIVTSENGKVFVMNGENDFNFAVTVDGETFTFDMADLPPMPPMPAMPALDGMMFSQDGNSFHMEFDTEKLQSLEDSPEFAEWEAKMEAWGEEMEVWGEMVEERAEAWEAEMEPRIEAWADAQAERWESQVEFMVERAERQSERAEEMADRARDRAERDAERARDRAERAFEREQRRTWTWSRGENDQGGAAYDGVTSPETRDFGNKSFKKIELGSGLSMVYSQDPNASVTATLERGKWDQVEIKVEGDTLVAKKKKNSNWGRYGPKLKIYASSPNLTSVDASSGSSFQGNVVAGKLNVDASSGSSLSMEGACTALTLDASSGSSVSLDKLECESANVDAGSGASIRVFASKKVDVDASSGSSISVSGNPTDVTTDKSMGASVRIR
jgi:beta-lactamase regulating signal transducer with metallopeptidase domain